MVPKDKGRRHGEGHIDHLTSAVHIGHHAEHGDIVGQGSHQSRRRHIVDPQQPAQPHEGLLKGLGDDKDQGKGSGQDDGDLPYHGKALLNGGQAGDEDQPGEGLHDGGGQSDGNDGHHNLAEDGEALHHGTGDPPQPQGQQQGDEDDGDEIPKDHAQGEPGGQASGQGPQGDGDHPCQHPPGQGLQVLFLEDAQGHRDGKDNGGAQHGPHNEPPELPRLGVRASSLARAAPPMSLARMVPANMAGSAPRKV